jgi:hypothetical protein
MLPMAIGIGSTGAEMTRPMELYPLEDWYFHFPYSNNYSGFYFITTKNIHAKKESQ